MKGVIENDLSLQDALSRKYGNYTAIARLIKPKVEKDLGHKVNFDSLITSVKRIKPRFQLSEGGIESVLARSVVNVRTDVAKLNLDKSKRALESARNVMASYQEEFLQVSESNSAITMIFDQKLLEEIHKKFNDDDVLDEQSDLAAIIVHSPTEIVRTPGVVLSIYTKIAENHVNIEDTVSLFHRYDNRDQDGRSCENVFVPDGSDFRVSIEDKETTKRSNSQMTSQASDIRSSFSKNLLSLDELSSSEFRSILHLAEILKAERAQRKFVHQIPGTSLALLFEKPRTRTRVSLKLGCLNLEVTP